MTRVVVAAWILGASVLASAQRIDVGVVFADGSTLGRQLLAELRGQGFVAERTSSREAARVTAHVQDQSVSLCPGSFDDCERVEGSSPTMVFVRAIEVARALVSASRSADPSFPVVTSDETDESDANESDANESDANESDANESDANESDANESDANESDANRNDPSTTAHFRLGVEAILPHANWRTGMSLVTAFSWRPHRTWGVVLGIRGTLVRPRVLHAAGEARVGGGAVWLGGVARLGTDLHHADLLAGIGGGVAQLDVKARPPWRGESRVVGFALGVVEASYVVTVRPWFEVLLSARAEIPLPKRALIFVDQEVAQLGPSVSIGFASRIRLR
ncbi:MAG: hypothetical protein AAGE52_20975 [Myxococcota bacterium]